MTGSSPRASGATPRVVVVGGGIAGLSVAHAVRAQAPGAEVVVLERCARIGGYVRSERLDGYLCEAGPDGFLDNAPATLALVNELGLASRMLPSRDEARRRFIFRGGRLHAVPLSAAAFLASGLLSLRGKLRVAREPFTRPARHDDESIFQFAERHIGPEAAHVLIGSMVSGIFGGDARELSLRACFPKMRDMDERYGSLVRAMIAKRRRTNNGVGAPAGRLTSFVDGMEELVRATAASLGSAVRTNQHVTALCPRMVRGRGFSVTSNQGGVDADAVVLTGAAHATAELVRPFAPSAAALLADIRTAPLTVVCLGYDEASLVAARGALDGFGFLIPRGEGPRILGALWETSIYDGRAPRGKVLLRVMVGGATDLEAVNLGDAELLAVARDDLRRTMRLQLAPVFVHIVRHRRGIPQYTTGHDARLQRLDGILAEHPGLFVAGSSYRGVSMNACVEDARRVAKRVADHLLGVERFADAAGAH